MNLNIPRTHTRNLNVPKQFMPSHDLQAIRVKEIRSLALRKATSNLLGAIFVGYAAYSFYMSSQYIRLLSHEGQVNFLRSYSKLMLYILKVTELIANLVPNLFNTINTVVPAYTGVLARNFLTNPVETIGKFHKRAGLTMKNIPILAIAAGTGGAINVMAARGNAVGTALSSLAAIPSEGMRQFLELSQGMNTTKLTRLYLTATVVGGMGQVRAYMESVTREVLRGAMVAVIAAMGTTLTEAGKGAIGYVKAPEIAAWSLKKPVKPLAIKSKQNTK